MLNKTISPIPRACDTEEHKKFPFCNISLTLDERMLILILNTFSHINRKFDLIL